MIRLGIIALLSLGATCTPNPAPPSGTDPAAVCQHLSDIGCPQPSTCAATLRTKQGVFADYKPACLADAGSAAAAEACGTIRCAP